MSKLITLTTDFGLEDEYVGVMKGVILSLAPSARIVDLSHGIEPQNIVQAAYLIDSGSRFFPDNTIHIIVVDPGVGGKRKLILAGARGQLFLTPDNGILSLLINNDEISFARELVNEKLFIHPVGKTFHGRDILAPVAAHLTTDAAVEEVGPLIEPEKLVQLNLAPVIKAGGNEITGTVIHIDRFGNLITNIEKQMAKHLFTNGNKPKPSVIIGNQTIINHVDCYQNAENDGLLTLFGSRGYLEISINNGNAAKFLGISIGDIVNLEVN